MERHGSGAKVRFYVMRRDEGALTSAELLFLGGHFWRRLQQDCDEARFHLPAIGAMSVNDEPVVIDRLAGDNVSIVYSSSKIDVFVVGDCLRGFEYECSDCGCACKVPSRH
jgi:hypothetical protein